MSTERVVTVRLRVPPWLSDKDVERLVKQLEEELWDQVPVAHLRQALGISDDELSYDVELVDWRELEEKEKKRIREIQARMG